MKLVKQTLIAAAVGATMFGGAAHAGAIGTAYLSIEDLIASKSDGTVLQFGTDVQPIGTGIINVGDTRATLDGVTQDETLQAPPAPVNDVGGAGFSCVGACTYVNNTFSYLTKPADTAASYVVSDIVLTGALVEGIPDGSGGVIPTGANAQALAESAVLPDGVGSAESNVGVNSSFEFVSQVDTDLTFSGSFDAYLRAALIDLEGFSANAEIGWTVSLLDVTDGAIFTYNLASDDDWLTGNLSTTIPNTDFESGSFGGAFSASTTGGFLKAGNAYQLTVTHAVVADSAAVAVAIPAPLALMGAGLLVLGGLQRKRNRDAAA
jgi:hypothetical protein